MNFDCTAFYKICGEQKEAKALHTEIAWWKAQAAKLECTMMQEKRDTNSEAQSKLQESLSKAENLEENLNAQRDRVQHAENVIAQVRKLTSSLLCIVDLLTRRLFKM